MKRCPIAGLGVLAFLAVLFFAGSARTAGNEAARPRVISLYAAHTEVLLRVGARDNLIGVSGQETYRGPETEGWKKPPVFSIRDDVEKFLAAKPDLVLMRPYHVAAGRQLVTTLESAGIKVYSAQVLRAGDLYQYWRNLAGLVGRQEAGERMILDFDSRIAAYHAAASRRAEKDKPGVFLEAVHEQIKTFTPDSLPVWLVELAGGRNVAADAKPNAPGLIVADYGPERLLAKANQVDIFISQEGPMNSTPLSQVKGRGIYKSLKAFKTNRVYKIPEDILARPTPSLLEGLEQLAAWTGLTAEDPALAGPAEEGAPAPSAAPVDDDEEFADPEAPAPPSAAPPLDLKVDLPPQN